VPVVAANRIGHERGHPTEISFYGSSFITDATGAKVAEAGRAEEAVLVADVDVVANRELRLSWGVFRDRRPDLYGPLMHLGGSES
jgi:N-carbamoylputrescine amidase